VLVGSFGGGDRQGSAAAAVVAHHYSADMGMRHRSVTVLALLWSVAVAEVLHTIVAIGWAQWKYEVVSHGGSGFGVLLYDLLPLQELWPVTMGISLLLLLGATAAFGWWHSCAHRDGLSVPTFPWRTGAAVIGLLTCASDGYFVTADAAHSLDVRRGVVEVAQSTLHTR
jgi:hypothetical protein